jgi:hypothetical protein
MLPSLPRRDYAVVGDARLRRETGPRCGATYQSSPLLERGRQLRPDYSGQCAACHQGCDALR